MPKTILLVEDNDDDVFLITRAFKNVGLVTPMVRATDGQNAIDYLSGKGDYADRVKFPMPALVLLDIKMPFLTGLEVLRWIRAQARLAALPVVMFTTSSQECDVRSAYGSGANAFLVKPARLEECTSVANVIKQFWIDANVAPPLEVAPHPPQPEASPREPARKPRTFGHYI
ncbi:MAG TPA: response regulator [Methylomirabilota bacterium]|nr:response regulator [Methylomirabilota bacterium]